MIFSHHRPFVRGIPSTRWILLTKGPCNVENVSMLWRLMNPHILRRDGSVMRWEFREGVLVMSTYLHAMIWRLGSDVSRVIEHLDVSPAARARSEIPSWRRHQMETYSVLLAICDGNPPVTGGFPSQMPVTRSFDVFFNVLQNTLLSIQSRYRWFETLWR